MKKSALAAACTLALSGAAYGQTHNEVGEAPELVPGQATAGVGALTQINGTFGGATPGNDADLFAIQITNEAAFTATTVGLSTLDTQLFLFNAAGNGVTFNDDDPIGTTLQSRLSSAFVTTNGLYYIGISQFDRDPQNGANQIWLDTPFNTERAPDGLGAPGPLTVWGGVGGIAGGTYGIALTGASFVPEPTTLALLPLAGLLGLRRRR